MIRRLLSRFMAVPARPVVPPSTDDRQATLNSDRFDRYGFDVIALLDSDDTASVAAVLEDAGVDGSTPFFASPAHAWGETAADIHMQLRTLLDARLAALLPGYEPFMIAVTAKGGRGPEIKFHHDWTYTDERYHRPIFLWCPLVDCTPTTGSLKVVPGSHRWSGGIRPSRRIEVTEAHQQHYETLSIGPDMRAGHAIAFDPALIHGSGPNPLDEPRPAITVALAPQEAQLVHFHESDGGRLDGFEVDAAFFTTNPYGTRPRGYPTFAPWADAVSEDELASELRRSGVLRSPEFTS